MLLELHIRNMALIEKADLEFYREKQEQENLS